MCCVVVNKCCGYFSIEVSPDETGSQSLTRCVSAEENIGDEDLICPWNHIHILLKHYSADSVFWPIIFWMPVCPRHVTVKLLSAKTNKMADIYFILNGNAIFWYRFGIKMCFYNISCKKCAFHCHNLHSLILYDIKLLLLLITQLFLMSWNAPFHCMGPSQLPGVNYFLIIHRCLAYNDRFFAVFHITPQVVR